MADEAEPVEGEEATTKADEVQVDAAAGAAGKTDEGQNKPEPGTPDKALQKMQQELGNAVREIEALKQKKQDGDGLSDADRAKLAKAQQRIDKIRQFVGRPDREEIPSEVDPVAETVLELSEKVGEQDALKNELLATKQRLQALENAQNWQLARASYDGLDVDAIWQKATEDALETLGEAGTHDAVNRLASKWFKERCEAAKKRLKDDGKGAAANNKGPESSPSIYKVGDGHKSAPQMSEEDEALAEARQLIREI